MYKILITRRITDGDSDVGDVIMLVTLWWWLIWDVGGRIIMFATFFRYVGDFLNVLNRSPISLGVEVPVTNTI